MWICFNIKPHSMLVLFLWISLVTSSTSSASLPSTSAWLTKDIRGGAVDEATTTSSNSLLKWRLEQQQLYHLRSTFLSEALASRGLPLKTMLQVSTVEGDRPITVDWDCAMSTSTHPKTCLYSFDAQIGTKVVAPLGTTEWIGLTSLNRLRRMDPSKVEPMWHGKYKILSSWFGEDETSLLQHVGVRGWVISAVLLDSPWVLKTILSASIITILFILLPLLDSFVSALLISEFFWKKYQNWARLAHGPLPFKLLMGQMAWKFLSKKFDALEKSVRDSIVDVECRIMEQTVPVTVWDKLEEEEQEVDDEEADDEFGEVESYVDDEEYEDDVEYEEEYDEY